MFILVVTIAVALHTPETVALDATRYATFDQCRVNAPAAEASARAVEIAFGAYPPYVHAVAECRQVIEKGRQL